MTTYYNQNEINTAMNGLVQEYLQECIQCEEIPADFIDLVKHNFRAKFVHYSPTTNSIEIGIKEYYSSDDLYPEIKVYSYPLDKKNQWLKKSFKNDKEDLAFYCKLLNRKKSFSKDAEVILM